MALTENRKLLKIIDQNNAPLCSNISKILRVNYSIYNTWKFIKFRFLFKTSSPLCLTRKMEN